MEDEHALKDYCVEDKCVVLIIEKESNIQGCLYYPVEIIVPVLDYLDGYSENVYSYEIQNMFKVSLTFISIIQGMVYLLTAVTTYFINIPYYIYICILGVIISIVIFFIASCPSPRSLRVVKAILIVMSLVTTSFTIFYFFPWDSLMNVENIQATLNLIFPIIANIVPLLYIERINRRVNNNLRDRGSTVSDLGIID